MFSTERVGCYLNGFAGTGDDNENKELKLVFHVNPITPDLAIEISPHLADRLFRSIAGEWEPAREITKAMFSSVQIQMQNITFNSLPILGIGDDGVLVPSCAISNLRAQRGDGPDFRLEFDVVVPFDSETMRLVEQYYKSTCFLTMQPIQRDIEYERVSDPVLSESLQEAADTPSEEAKPKRGRKKKAVAQEAEADAIRQDIAEIGANIRLEAADVQA